MAVTKTGHVTQEAMSMTHASSVRIEAVAYRMFLRNVADYAEPVLAELAWIDPDVRGFWVAQAEGVFDDVTELVRRSAP